MAGAVEAVLPLWCTGVDGLKTASSFEGEPDPLCVITAAIRLRREGVFGNGIESLWVAAEVDENRDGWGMSCRILVGDLDDFGSERKAGNEGDEVELLGEADASVRVNAEVLVGMARRGRSASGMGGTGVVSGCSCYRSDDQIRCLATEQTLAKYLHPAF